MNVPWLSGGSEKKCSRTHLDVSLFDVREEYVLRQQSDTSEKRYRIGEFAHLLGFVEPVDLIEEYDCLSITLRREVGGIDEDTIQTVWRVCGGSWLLQKPRAVGQFLNQWH
jgi:hypothetical protein